MKKASLLLVVLLSLCLRGNSQQTGNDTVFCLITCGTGTETYSIYGHSALRVIIPGQKLDLVYNWGVFDFETPNFAWKFAKGRLDYMLDVESMKSFLQAYFYEKRWVQSQRLNLDPAEKARLAGLLSENLRPENIKYRYDFFYDDCSTRIRDLIEKAIGGKLLYPPVTKGRAPSFRTLVGKYQDPFPWLKFGIDLIMGSTADKAAAYRDRMFLPIDLQNELSEAVVNRNGKMIPLLQNPETLLGFDAPVIKNNFLLAPAFVFTALLILTLIFTGLVRDRKIARWADIVLFSVYSVLAILMIFFNFLTDHPQMHWNLNIIWLNPVIIVCVLLLIMRREGTLWFRLLFYILAAFLVLHLILPQYFEIAILPLVLVLLVRCSVRGGFSWNPVSL